MRENTVRAKDILTLFYVFTAFFCINISLGIYRHRLFSGYTESATEGIPEWIEMLDWIMPVTETFLYILCIIFFIRWFRRAYLNLQKSGEYRPRFDEGWAAGSWFIPVLNWFRPFSIMAEIWDVTIEKGLGKDHGKSRDILGWWWAFWLISVFADRIASRLSLAAETMDDIMAANTYEIVASSVRLVALVLIIKIITDISQAEKYWYQAKNARKVVVDPGI